MANLPAAMNTSTPTHNPNRNPSSGDGYSDEQLKLAVAMALLRHRSHHQSATNSTAADHWKKKAKDRKREIQRLRKEIQKLEDETHAEVVQQITSCKCYFFDGMQNGGDEHWIGDVLRKRFMRLVRQKERRRKADGSALKRIVLEFNNEDEIYRLSTSIDFLVEHSSVRQVNDSSFATVSHQAVDFILGSLRNLLSLQKDNELIEEIVNGLIMRLTKRMCEFDNDESYSSGVDSQCHVQHLLRKLGMEPFMCHRVILSVSQRLCIQAESLLFMDPFDDAFPDLHESMFMMIQLIEFLITDYASTWLSTEDLDLRLLEEWIRSILQARKAAELLENRNGLYILYIDRVTGQLAKQAGRFLRERGFDPGILSSLLG